MQALKQGLSEAESLREYFDTVDSARVVALLMQDGVLLPSEKNRYLHTDTGLLNPDGKRFIEEALRGRIASNYDVLMKLPSSIVTKIDAVIPQILIAEQTGQQWNITDTMRQTIDLVQEYQQSGIAKPEMFLRQYNFRTGKTAGDRYAPTVQKLFLKLMNDKKKDFVKAFSRYASQAHTSAENNGLPGVAQTSEQALETLLKPTLIGRFETMPVVEADSTQFFGSDKEIDLNSENLRKATLQWAKEKYSEGTSVVNADQGWTVQITHRGIKSTLSHGFDDTLAKTVPFIPQIIESGIYLQSTEKKADLISHIFANKINLDGKEYVVGFVLREDNNGNRFYDHELTEVIDPDLLQPRRQLSEKVTEQWARSNQGTVINILRDKLGVKDGTAKIFFQDAYHGSPHRFSEFSTDAIGTGEGAQAHGWGLYFAQDKNTSNTYRKKLSGDNTPTVVKINNQSYYLQSSIDNDTINNYDFWDAFFTTNWGQINPYEHKHLVELYKQHITEKDNAEYVQYLENELAKSKKSYDSTLADYNKYSNYLSEDKKQEYLTSLNTLQENISQYEHRLSEYQNHEAQVEIENLDQRGQLFKVDIPENDVLLDEQDKFEEQSAKIQHVWQKAVNEFNLTEIDAESSGRDFYRALSKALDRSDQAASLWLKDQGVEGITYDGARDGRCYVIFDENQVNILKTYYQADNQQQARTPIVVRSEELGVPEGSDIREYIAAAKKYHDALKYESEHGHPVKQPQLDKVVRFSGQGWKKNAHAGANIKKWKMFTKLREIIENSEKKETSAIQEGKHKDFMASHWCEADVELDGQQYRIGFTLLEDRKGNLFYNLNPDLENTDKENAPSGIPQTQERGHTKELFEKTQTKLLNNKAETVRVFDQDDFKSSDKNNLQSSDEDVNINLHILQQNNFQQKRKTSPRGKISLTNPLAGDAIIELFTTADVSTVLHELSHFWLETYREAAMQDNAPQQVKDDWTKLQKIYKFEGYLTEQENAQKWTETQEDWAKQFEAYVREGQAPSSYLAETFRRFRKWLTDIYQSLKKLLGKQAMKPELHEIFEHLLAVDEEIAQYKEDLASRRELAGRVSEKRHGRSGSFGLCRSGCANVAGRWRAV